MIRDPQESVLLSSLGWVDGANLWRLSLSNGSVSLVPLSSAKWLSLHHREAQFFSVAHHFDNGRLEFTAHTFASPEAAVSRAIIDGPRCEIAGDTQVWRHLPRSYVGYCCGAGWADFGLIRITLDPPEISTQQLDWYDDSYDKGYQGIVDVAEVPGSHLVIISVQRDSHPIIYDPVQRVAVGKLQLAGSHGNPRPYFRRHASELWVDDYDTLVQIDPGTWKTVNVQRIQPAPKGTARFIGQFAFDEDERVCVVARPFSGDVVGITTNDRKVHYRCVTGEQPLEVSVLSDYRVFARDWKTGRLLTGTLSPTSHL